MENKPGLQKLKTPIRMADIGLALLGLIITAVSIGITMVLLIIFLNISFEPFEILGFLYLPFLPFFHNAPLLVRITGLFYLVAPAIAIFRRNGARNWLIVVVMGIVSGLFAGMIFHYLLLST